MPRRAYVFLRISGGCCRVTNPMLFTMKCHQLTSLLCADTALRGGCLRLASAFPERHPELTVALGPPVTRIFVCSDQYIRTLLGQRLGEWNMAYLAARAMTPVPPSPWLSR